MLDKVADKDFRDFYGVWGIFVVVFVLFPGLYFARKKVVRGYNAFFYAKISLALNSLC